MGGFKTVERTKSKHPSKWKLKLKLFPIGGFINLKNLNNCLGRRSAGCLASGFSRFYQDLIPTSSRFEDKSVVKSGFEKSRLSDQIFFMLSYTLLQKFQFFSAKNQDSEKS